VTDFKTYYKQQFQRDLLNFVGQIPIDGNKHYDRNEFNIQYFFLIPHYKYLDIIPQDRQGLFAGERGHSHDLPAGFLWELVFWFTHVDLLFF